MHEKLRAIIIIIIIIMNKNNNNKPGCQDQHFSISKMRQERVFLGIDGEGFSLEQTKKKKKKKKKWLEKKKKNEKKNNEKIK